jgi:hypothetical protein
MDPWMAGATVGEDKIGRVAWKLPDQINAGVLGKMKVGIANFTGLFA